MYSGSSLRFGSDSMPERESMLTWYWSMTQSRAERLPRRYSKTSGGMPASVSESFTRTAPPIDNTYAAAARCGSAAAFGSMTPPSCSTLQPGTAAWKSVAPFAVTPVLRTSRPVSPLQSLKAASPASVTFVSYRLRYVSPL